MLLLNLFRPPRDEKRSPDRRAVVRQNALAEAPLPYLKLLLEKPKPQIWDWLQNHGYWHTSLPQVPTKAEQAKTSPGHPAGGSRIIRGRFWDLPAEPRLEDKGRRC